MYCHGHKGLSVVEYLCAKVSVSCIVTSELCQFYIYRRVNSSLYAGLNKYKS